MTHGLPFNQFDLGQCKNGDVWRVELSRAANVFMVDSSNFSAFKSDRAFNYYGGLIERSPHDFVVPRSGRWYIVAHTWGLRDSAKISVTPLQAVGPMPAATPQQVDLASIASRVFRTSRGYLSCSGQGSLTSSSSRMRRWVAVSRSRTMPSAV